MKKKKKYEGKTFRKGSIVVWRTHKKGNALFHKHSLGVSVRKTLLQNRARPTQCVCVPVVAVEYLCYSYALDGKWLGWFRFNAHIDNGESTTFDLVRCQKASGAGTSVALWPRYKHIKSMGNCFSCQSCLSASLTHTPHSAHMIIIYGRHCRPRCLWLGLWITFGYGRRGRWCWTAISHENHCADGNVCRCVRFHTVQPLILIEIENKQ